MNYLASHGKELQQKLRQEAKSLLKEHKADLVYGFEAGSLKFTTSPLLTGDIKALDRLVINPFIVNNLANFLVGQNKRVAIAAKGCDSRSIVSLIQDNKVKREDLFIIGIPCSGIVDLTKVEKLTGKDRDQVTDIAFSNSKVTIATDDDTKEVSINQVLFDCCLGCELTTPEEYDILLGEQVSPISEKEISYKSIEELKTKSHEERWQFWKQQFEHCIKCYACRNVCPACYCQRCFVEESEPQWLQPMPLWQDNLMFQVIRNIHVAGRCTDCGECQRACPVGIPLRSLTRDMYDTVDELFQFKSGMDKQQQPLLTSYEADEAEGIFL